MTAPIISQPQVAIISTDGVALRPVAVPTGDGHGIAVHPVGNLSLSFDHRAFDGAYASAFLGRVVELLETRRLDEELGVTARRGVDATEAVEDFRLACISRAIDDREIALQKQTRVFFQISGAGHEALLLGLARELRPGYDWFFPYYRDQALMLGLGVTPDRDPAAGGGQRGRPVVGRSPDARALGRRRAQRRHAVEPDRQPVPRRGRLRGGGALSVPPPAPARARARTATSSPTCRWGRARRRRATSGRA